MIQSDSQRATATTSAAPATARATERRREIAVAAARIFRDHGFEAASMARIANAAGISKPGLYLYFETKEALFTEAALSGCAEVLPRLQTIAEDNRRDFADRLRDMICVIYEALMETSTGDMMIVIAETSERFPSVARFFRDEFKAKLDGLFLSHIRAGEAAGDFRVTPYSRQIELLTGPIVAAALNKAMFKSLEPGADQEQVSKSLRDDHVTTVLMTLRPERDDDR